MPPSRAAFSTSSAQLAGSGWGMGRSWGLLPYSRRLDPAIAERRVAKEMKRTHPNPVPEGTCSAAISLTAVSRTPRLQSGFEPIILTRSPHLVEHDSQLAGQRDLCLAQASALGQTNRPGFQRTPPLAVMDQH